MLRCLLFVQIVTALRVLVVGGTGTVGQGVVNALKAQGADVVVASPSSGIKVDITNTESIKAMYSTIGKVDHVVCCAGSSYFGPLSSLTPANVTASFANKLGGQINLVLLGFDSVSDGGSFTLITGILSRVPIKLGSMNAAVSGGLDAFVKAAALEMPRGLRINTVSPTVLTEAISEYGPFMQGFVPVPSAVAANGFIRSIYGGITGQTVFVDGIVPNV